MVLIRIDIHGCLCVSVCVHSGDTALNLHGYQEGNKQHVAVLISLWSFYLHATPVFSILFVDFLGLKYEIGGWPPQLILYIHFLQSSRA